MEKPSGKISRAEMELAVDYMREVLPAQLQVLGLHAEILKAKFDALVREGFTEQQALEIVKSRPIFE